jgi:hypothetical protein
MNGGLGTYSFLPWLRSGIANQITAQDQDPAVTTRATVGVTLHLAGTPVGEQPSPQADITKQIELYGPGDIIGVDARAIVKTEPRNWVTNFEPNYLAGIDFYDEDFPWRYTPAAPLAGNGNRLKPWLALLVLKEAQDGEPGEFVDGRAAGKPLPFIVVEDAALFPPSADLQAWARTRQPVADRRPDRRQCRPRARPVLDRFGQTLAENGPGVLADPVAAQTRADRRTAFRPAYETGRLAGLGLDPADAPHATHGAWDRTRPVRSEPVSYPVYYRWFFRTSTVGDFEYLVRLIEPRPMDSRVGRRDMDVQAPGANVPGILDPELGGVLKLGDALQVPETVLSQPERDEVAKYENWDEPYPHPFQQRLAEFVNLADAYSEQSVKDAHDATQLPDLDPTDDNPDPLITPPLYGPLARADPAAADRPRGPTGREQPATGSTGEDLDPVPGGSSFGSRGGAGHRKPRWRRPGRRSATSSRRTVRSAGPRSPSRCRRSGATTHLAALTRADPSSSWPSPLRSTGASWSTAPPAGSGQRATYVPRVVLSAPMRRIARPRVNAVRALRGLRSAGHAHAAQRA